MKIAVAINKGGCGKTCTAMHLAFGLARNGERVLLVDADARSATAMDWSETAANLHQAGHGPAWPSNIVVVPWPTQDLAKRVTPLLANFDHLVIDCGGDDTTITRQALLVCDELIIPAAPSLSDIRRIPATINTAAEVDAISPVNVRVLLTRVRTQTRSSREVREELAQLPVMDAQVRLTEAYAQALGTVPDQLGDYELVLAELMDEARQEVPA